MKAPTPEQVMGMKEDFVEAAAASIEQRIAAIDSANRTSKEWTTLKQDWTLHIGLILKQTTVSPSRAVLLAYAEGTPGLQRRLGQLALPLGAPTPGPVDTLQQP